MFHDHVARDGQAEAGTLAGLLGGEERFEDVLQVGGADAAAIVGDREADRAGRCDGNADGFRRRRGPRPAHCSRA